MRISKEEKEILKKILKTAETTCYSAGEILNLAGAICDLAMAEAVTPTKALNSVGIFDLNVNKAP